ncbi:GDP-mannose 4,6-dehydratase [Candidatus Micrarchaeota archaeon]|nr:GDP-mannose 4,6-dehydratase [Candidatus Micrarchaeota archaeon]
MDLVPVDSVFNADKFKTLKSSGFLIDIEKMEAYESSLKQKKSTQPSPSYWKEKRVLITGASGMVGSTLIDLLMGMGAEVHAIIRRHAVDYHPHLEHHMDGGKIRTYEVDLKDYGRVSSLVKEIDPHVISHQAAESFVPTSLQQPSHVVENNCVSTVNVLEASAKEGKSVEAVQVACSSEQYGFIKDVSELPVKEENELRPTSTYAATKVFTEYIAKSYYYTYGTPTVITRTFNQEGPRRGPHFFTARVAIQVRKILDGKSDKLVLGNPNSVRDFTHVHDSTKAQLLAIEKCERGSAYNICSEKGITTGDYAKLALRVSGLEGKVPFLVDKKLLRPYEKGHALFDGFIGSNAKLQEKTGWSPTKSVVDIINDQVEFYKTYQR